MSDIALLEIAEDVRCVWVGVWRACVWVCFGECVLVRVGVCVCVCEREREHVHSCACAHIFQMSRNYLKILDTRRVKQFSYRGSTYVRHHHKKM